MKLKMLGLAIALFMGTTGAFATETSGKFQVNGKCGMCEKHIEKAALAVDGVVGADWNKETKEMSVVWDDSKTNVHMVQMAIAKVGHDTGMHKASDEAYSKLPSCCQYDRSSLEVEEMPMKHMQ